MQKGKKPLPSAPIKKILEEMKEANDSSYVDLLNAGMRPYTFQQWTIKHKNRLRGLGPVDTRKRYDQYLLQFHVGGGQQSRKAGRQQFKKALDYSADSLGSTTQMSVGTLSECTLLYAQALTNPWDLKQAPCVPDLVTLPSYKAGFRARGVMGVGTAGVGWINANPYSVACMLGGIIPRQPAGAYSTGTYGSPDYNLSDLGIIAYDNDSPYNTGQVGVNGINYRTVGCGLRIRYTGPELTRAGRIIGVRMPLNTNVPDHSTAVTLLSNRESVTNPVTRGWHYVSYRPALAADLAYRSINQNNDSLLLYIDGATPGTSFEFDFIAYFEIIGTNLPSQSKSHSDPSGMAAVQMALPDHQPTNDPSTDFSNLISNVISAGKTAFSFISPLISAVGGAENILPTLGALFL